MNKLVSAIGDGIKFTVFIILVAVILYAVSWIIWTAALQLGWYCLIPATIFITSATVFYLRR